MESTASKDLPAEQLYKEYLIFLLGKDAVSTFKTPAQHYKESESKKRFVITPDIIDLLRQRPSVPPTPPKARDTTP